MFQQPSSEQLQRINVIGSSGSGKSRFAKQLAEQLGHPYVDMDLLFWKPNWTLPSDEEYFPKLEAALQQPRWILDGNYSRCQPIKWKNVTAIIWLNYSFPRTLWQITIRAIRRSITQQELWPHTGNRESFRRAFFSRKESIILWMIQNFKKLQKRYGSISQDPRYTHILVVELKNPREAKDFLKSLKNNHF